jgi:hypothetical protein
VYFRESNVSELLIASVFRVDEEAKQETSRSNRQAEFSSVGSILGLLFDPEDGGDLFFRNAGLFLRPTRRYNPEDRTLHIVSQIVTSSLES